MISEAILTTLNEDQSVHIAPMGVRCEGDTYLIAPFRPSTTLQNLQRSGRAVINFTDDVRIFAGCLTGRYDWPTREAHAFPGRVLEGALAHVEVSVESFEDDPLRPRFHCGVLHRETHRPFHGFNRAQAAVIEAAILVSRLGRIPDEKVEREMDYLRIAVDKTAGEAERTAWGWLEENVAGYFSRDARKSRAS